MQVEPVSRNSPNAVDVGTLSHMDVECLFEDLERSKLAESHPGFEVRSVRKAAGKAADGEEQTDSSNSLEERWNLWLFQRDQLRTLIKRGQECLKQVQKELAATRAELEEWPAYEQICGKNPLGDYFQSIAAKEQIAKFLPNWLKRQQDQLQGVSRKINRFARQNRGRERSL